MFYQDNQVSYSGKAFRRIGTYLSSLFLLAALSLSFAQMTAALEAGPIWSNDDAQGKCTELAAKSNGTWTGQWWTTVEGAMSVCEISLNFPEEKMAIEAGPIWSNDDAQGKCADVAARAHGTWQGQWWTTVEGQMSVCELHVSLISPALEAGPIWDQADADNKCPGLATETGGQWTGQWWTTVEGAMSVCQISYQQAVIEAGPIWSNDDAQSKCPAVASDNSGSWNGQWWTTVEGQMSVCVVIGYWLD
ncbi:MAG: mannan-binding lectin [Deinococcales bacterium]